MQSIEAKLAESVGKMTEAQRTKFHSKRKGGMPVESQVALAETVLMESSGRIRRNNGGSAIAESADPFAKGDAILLEGLHKARPAHGMDKIAEAGQAFDGLSEAERADAEFCRLLGMTEAESLKVAKSGFISRR